MKYLVIGLLIILLLIIIWISLPYLEFTPKKKGTVWVEMKEEDIEKYNKLFSEVYMLLESDYSIEEIITYLEKIKER